METERGTAQKEENNVQMKLKALKIQLHALMYIFL